MLQVDFELHRVSQLWQSFRDQTTAFIPLRSHFHMTAVRASWDNKVFICKTDNCVSPSFADTYNVGVGKVCSEHLLHLLVLNLRVILRKQFLLLLVVVVRAVVSFRMTVLWAVDVTTFAGVLNKTYFAVALPTLTSVCLYFWFFGLHFFLSFFGFHFHINFRDWPSIQTRLHWLLHFLFRLSWLLLRQLHSWWDGICNFLDKLLDWRSTCRILLFWVLLVFEALWTQEVRILATIEGLTDVTKS